MRQLMERSYPEIWIEGELSSLSKPASGHLYFSLKDENAQLRCAMFRSRAGLSRYTPKSGDLVKVRAKISVYTARGDLQCIVQHIEDAGAGVLHRRFEELKAKLNQEGLFDAHTKHTVPKHPRRIGLITSPSGAAIRDVLSTLQRRNPSTPVTIYPAVVQGDGAASSIISALNEAQQHAQCDVLILTRGGGSAEDLWCFNDEALARAIHACAIPTINAVGHEVDVTIADFVADMRAPTPTAAAELLSPDRDQLLSDLASTGRRLEQSMQRQQQQLGQTVDLWFGRLKHPRERLLRQKDVLNRQGAQLMKLAVGQRTARQSAWQQTLARLLRRSPEQLIDAHSKQVSALSQRLKRAEQSTQQQRRAHFSHLGEQLNIVSPLATLERGFAIARDNKQRIVRDSASLQLGDALAVQLKRGELLCEVVAIDAPNSAEKSA